LITYKSFSIPIKKEDKKGRKQIGNNETNENEDEGADHDANAVGHQGKEFRVGRRVLQNFYQSAMNHLYEWGGGVNLIDPRIFCVEGFSYNEIMAEFSRMLYQVIFVVPPQLERPKFMVMVPDYELQTYIQEEIVLPSISG
jgi:hypothetical protein